MAVPESAYNSRDLQALGGSGIEGRFAKYLSAYPTRAKAKSLFYLDKLLENCTEDDAVFGFIGMVKQGGVNAAYHNLTTRDSGQHVGDAEDGGSYIVLKDAGLNTRPYCQITDIGYNGHLYAYDCPAEARIVSAYYLDTTRYKLTVRKGSTDYPVLSGTLAAAGSKNLSGQGAVSFGEGDLFTATVTVTNAEGSISSSRTGTVGPAITRCNMTKIASLTTDWDDGTAAVGYIYTQDLMAVESSVPQTAGTGGNTYNVVCPKGGEVVTSKERTGRLAAGYYVINKMTGIVVGSNGRITQSFTPKSDPPPVWQIELKAAAFQTYNGSAGWNNTGYIYRTRVTASWKLVSGKGDRPDVAIRLTNIILGTSNSQNGASMVSVSWRGSNGLPSQSPPPVSITIPAGSASATSEYLYADPGVSTPKYLRVTSYTVSPQTYSVVTPDTASGLSGGTSPVDPDQPITPVDPDQPIVPVNPDRPITPTE